MTVNPSYENLEQRIKSLEKETAELKKADEALRGSEEQYRILLDAADHAGHAIILDQDIEGTEGACVFSNETAAEITGYSREALSNLSWYDIIHPQYRDAALERHRKRMNGEVIQDLFELSIIRKDGKELPIEISSTLSEYQGNQALISFFRDITTRKMAEETLRKSEEKYRELIENAVVGVYQVTDTGKYLMANRKLASTFGYGSPREFLETVDHVSKLYVSPEQRDEILKEINSRGFIEGKEIAFKRKDGSPIWIELNTIATTIENGMVVYEGTAEDITERRQAERTIRQHNAYLSALHETTLGLMRRLDLDELLEAIVSRVAYLVGTKDGFVFLCDDEKGYIEMRVGLGAQKVYEGLRLKPGEGHAGKVWETGKPIIVNDYRAWDNRLQEARFDDIRASVGIPLKSESGISGVIGLAYFEENRKFTEQEASILSQFAELASIALDNARLYTNLKQELTERQKAERALRESELKYKTLTENALSGIFIHQDGKYVFVNDRFAEMCGYTPDELIGMIHYEVAHPDQKEMIKQRGLKRLAGEKVPRQYELKLIRKNGDEFWSELMVSDLINYKGRPAIMCHVADISALKKAEEMLKQTNEELEQRVENRTVELRISNEQLAIQKKNLEEVNTALRVLLKKRDEDKLKMEQKVVFNMNELLLPYMEKLNDSDLDERQKVLLDILESNLNDITSPFSQSLSHNYKGFTPSEMQIANLIKQGRTSKQIANLLNLSSRTIETHRKNIRKKLGLGNKKRNLRTHLMSIQ